MSAFGDPPPVDGSMDVAAADDAQWASDTLRQVAAAKNGAHLPPASLPFHGVAVSEVDLALRVYGMHEAVDESVLRAADAVLVRALGGKPEASEEIPFVPEPVARVPRDDDFDDTDERGLMFEGVPNE
jgi:hypothetical protein